MTVKTSKYMFTIAADEATDLATLLFSEAVSDPTELQTILHEMRKHPILQLAHPVGSEVIGDPTTGEWSLAPLEHNDYLPANYTKHGTPTLTIHTPKGEEPRLVTLNMVDYYETCSLPHKLLGGCEMCLTMETKRKCCAKAIYLEQVQSISAVATEAENLIPLLRNRADHLGRYMYISPALTKEEGKPFTMTIRPTDEHDFSQVDYRSEVITSANRERGRRTKFKKTVCTQCLVKDTCEHPPRCKGAYEFTEEEAAQKIVSEHEFPYADDFAAAVLAHYTKEIPFRVDRKLAHLSCRTSYKKRFEFGIMYDYTGEFNALPLGDLQDILKRMYVKLTEEIKPLSIPEKALLLELSRHAHSPTNNYEWHRTAYKNFFISLNGYENPKRNFSVTYRWNSNMEVIRHYRELEYRNRGWELPYGLNAVNLGDVYKQYACLETLSKNPHPLRHQYAWER